MSEERGKVDAASILYILGGIPTMVAFFVLLFISVKVCGTPA